MRGRILSVAAAIGVLALAACAPAPPAAPATGTPADEAAIRSFNTAYADAWNKADVAALVSFVTDDYEGVTPDGKAIKGKAAVEAMEKESAAGRAGIPLKLAIDTSYVRFTSATSAVTGGAWTVSGAPPGAPGPTKGAWTSTMLKVADGSWKVATALVADYMPPPPAPPAAPEKGKGK